MNRYTKYKIRYYYNYDYIEHNYDKWRLKVHEITISFLKKIKEQFGIDYELWPFRSGEEELIYTEHFASRGSLLNKIHDITVRNALKSRKGHVYLNDTIALVYDNNVIWYDKGWSRDFNIWKEELERFSRINNIPRYYMNLSLGFLLHILNNKEYLYNLINKIENYIETNRTNRRITYGNKSHDLLVFKVIEEKINKINNIAILVEVPLGTSIIKESFNKVLINNRYRDSIINTVLSSYPPRADMIVVYNPKNIAPGIYPCARGSKHAYRLMKLYTSRFPNNHVEILDSNFFPCTNVTGTSFEIIEVKTDNVDEKAIGQLLAYEILLKLESGSNNIIKTLVTTTDIYERINPLFHIIFKELNINVEYL